MKLLTRDTDYAVRAIRFIAESKKTVISASELQKNLKIPRPFLRKILQMLNKKRLLKSHKGKGGGFSLSRSPDKLFLLELMAVFQGPLALNEHIFLKRRCPNIKTCLLKRKIDEIEKYVFTQLESITIGCLIR